MSKGYLMANLRVDDPEIFKEFSSVALPLIEKYGGRLLARGPDADRHEGSWWPYWSTWIKARSSSHEKAYVPGSHKDYPSLGLAPGKYVMKNYK